MKTSQFLSNKTWLPHWLRRNHNDLITFPLQYLMTLVSTRQRLGAEQVDIKGLSGLTEPGFSSCLSTCSLALLHFFDQVCACIHPIVSHLKVHSLLCKAYWRKASVCWRIFLATTCPTWQRSGLFQNRSTRLNLCILAEYTDWQSKTPVPLKLISWTLWRTRALV